MNEQRAREILGNTIQSDGSLREGQQYTYWKPGESNVTLDSDFTADELEAIAWWMRNAPTPDLTVSESRNGA